RMPEEARAKDDANRASTNTAAYQHGSRENKVAFVGSAPGRHEQTKPRNVLGPQLKRDLQAPPIHPNVRPAPCRPRRAILFRRRAAVAVRERGSRRSPRVAPSTISDAPSLSGCSGRGRCLVPRENRHLQTSTRPATSLTGSHDLQLWSRHGGQTVRGDRTPPGPGHRSLRANFRHSVPTAKG